MITDVGYDLSSFITSPHFSPTTTRKNLLTNDSSASGGFYQLTFNDIDESIDHPETSQAFESNTKNSKLTSEASHSVESGTDGCNSLAVENLIQENLSLQQSLNRKSSELAETRAHLRGYSGYTLDDSNPIPGFFKWHLLHIYLDPYSENNNEVLRLESLRIQAQVHSGLLEVFNVPEFTRILIYAKRLMPCLPSYLLLMAFRFYDNTCDDAGLTGLFNAVHAILKDNSMNSTDTDVLALWLCNSWRLFNLLRQYSGEKHSDWKKQNTELQNSQCIKNYDLEPIRNQLKLRVEVLYNSLMKRSVEPLLIPKIVPGILQHESYDFLSASLPNGQQPELKENGRRHNITEIKCWLSQNKIETPEPIGEIFEPLIQASHLLQLRKSYSNLDLLCGDTTSKLKPKQILAILRHFTPSDGFEEDVIDEDFLNKISLKLSERNLNGNAEKDELLMRGTYLDPFNTERFLYSEMAIETITLPACLNFESCSRLI